MKARFKHLVGKVTLLKLLPVKRCNKNDCVDINLLSPFPWWHSTIPITSTIVPSYGQHPTLELVAHFLWATEILGITGTTTPKASMTMTYSFLGLSSKEPKGTPPSKPSKACCSFALKSLVVLLIVGSPPWALVSGIITRVVMERFDWLFSLLREPIKQEGCLS